MDIAKKKSKSRFSTKSIVAVIIVITCAFAVGFSKSHLNTVTLSKKDLLISEVKQGDLTISVGGYGKLVSEKLQLITALTQATVQEIVLKPGAVVSHDSIIVKLANPELHLSAENAKQELAQLQANLRQLRVNHKRELLTEEATIAELQSLFEAANLKRVAEQSLVEDGIVSELTFKQSQLNEKQLQKRINILTKRLAQLSEVHSEAINIQQQRVNQQLGKLEIAQSKVDRLIITAGFDGVLQRLSVNLGQSLAPGQEIALIGSTKELIAEIKIPQSQASTVLLDQIVIIDTRQAKIEGRVARIDPIVEQNTVRIDIALPPSLPASAKPQQSVDAEIITNTLRNVTYIERPANIQSQSETTLFALNHEQDSAQANLVRLGEKTGRYIEITSKVVPGQRYIISDLSNYQVKKISVN